MPNTSFKRRSQSTEIAATARNMDGGHPIPNTPRRSDFSKKKSTKDGVHDMYARLSAVNKESTADHTHPKEAPFSLNCNLMTTATDAGREQHRSKFRIGIREIK